MGGTLRLKRREDAHVLPKVRDKTGVSYTFGTRCFWSAMDPRITFILYCQ